MQLSDILSADGVVPSLKVSSKKQALHELAAIASKQTGLDVRQIFDTLLQRERLGSTGLGQGIAIPHGKLPGLSKLHTVFARVAQPIEFDSVDDQPVDLIFVLLAPESAGADHLKALARISRLLRDPEIVAKLRGSDSSAALYSILTEPTASASHAA
ncbi:PTS system nitrogen regulatory IIA component [Rhodoligotrophos appendicifer]|uniref:PTS IIA-like nitrogen regulatory protein PtsN n=1 Tax=Rhodoligotrophos appendicifer TaxID=987056 RepID=UPI00117EA40E|nr:PTS IIA-like nitrogen regulatory protein PtsN [Rhodoligotrophos appendicifer]